MDDEVALNRKAQRPANARHDDPLWEAVGNSEPCDWCSRPGTVEQFDIWGINEVLQCRNPALCNVCSYWFEVPGDVIDAFYDAGMHDYGEVMRPFNEELARRWRAKVAEGTRRPQQPADRPLSSGHFSPEPPSSDS